MTVPERMPNEQEIANRTAFLAEVQALGSDSPLTREVLINLGTYPVDTEIELPLSTGQFGDRTVIGETVIGTAYSTTEGGRSVEITKSNLL